MKGTKVLLVTQDGDARVCFSIKYIFGSVLWVICSGGDHAVMNVPRVTSNVSPPCVRMLQVHVYVWHHMYGR